MDRDRVRRAIEKVLVRRPGIAVKLKDQGIEIADLERLANQKSRFRNESGVVAVEVASAASLAAQVESIVEEVGRPALFVSGDDYELPADKELAQRLRSARHTVGGRLASVGRLEVFDGVIKWPVGTAWMVADKIAITNRHVAEKFARRDGAGNPVILTDLRGRPYKVVVDFREEHGSIVEREVLVESVLYLPDRSREISDIALLKLSGGAELPPPIPLLKERIAVTSWIAVVGYPQADERIPPEAREVEESYFSNVYGVKRLSPGQIDPASQVGFPEWIVAHDATTLGGHSGSVLLDLGTGSAVGIHFRGEFKKANYAVDSVEIFHVLSQLGIVPTLAGPVRAAGAGDAYVLGEEEAAEDLGAFKGYQSDFIGAAGDDVLKIPLPEITDRAPGVVAELKSGGTELRYRNFSVVMNRDRRLCYYSAVNIDGARTFSIKGARPGWRIDRRLNAEWQIIEECYGSEQDGRFSRGHMTRREDPNWGADRAEAVISNRHTFFVTNACPQMQPFNAGIWLSLEDYALENCDKDDMRISVFTGPIFRENDPAFFNVKVPIEFWKVIAFKNDKTRTLSATGYIMSQRDVLPTDEEFVFGQFRNSQVTIRSIEKITGLSFRHLRNYDPVDDATEAVAVRMLRTPADIVF